MGHGAAPVRFHENAPGPSPLGAPHDTPHCVQLTSPLLLVGVAVQLPGFDPATVNAQRVPSARRTVSVGAETVPRPQSVSAIYITEKSLAS